MSTQLVQAPDDVGRWILHKAPGVDSSWALEKALQKHTIPPASGRLDARKGSFAIFISRFLSSQGDQEARNIFQSATSWEDVRKEAEKAIDVYANQGSTWKNPFRRAIRLVGNVASRLEFLIELVPDGDYTKILCGGLKLAYNAANRNKQLRELILGCLDSLGSEIEYTKVLIREYAWNENLRAKTEDLYIAILDAVEAIMKWVGKHRGFRSILEAGKAIAKQEDYGIELETEVKTNINEKVEAFERAVRICLNIEVRSIATNVVTVGTTVDIIDGKIDGAVGELRRTVAAGKTLEDMLRGISDSMRLFMEEERRKYAQIAQNQENYYRLLYAQNYLQPANMVAYQPSLTTIPQLLQTLNLADPAPITNIDARIAEKISAERDLIFYFGLHFNPEEKSRMAAVLQDPRFDTWLKGNTSTTIIVNGFDLNAMHNTVVSPFAYLSAMLAKSFHDIPAVYPIAFFCRLHSDIEDALRSPSGLMRFLIAQLVLQHPNPSTLIYSLAAINLQAIEAQDLSSLCKLFDQVLQSLGTGMVVCMINDVNLFENETLLSGLDSTMRYLSSLIQAVSRSQSGITFKLLLTSSMSIENSRYWFPEAVELALPGDALVSRMAPEGAYMFMGYTGMSV
ncbi:hypothetical protein F5Y11DRAFT_131589 [Daldinia sp. FL1419]|nr:hypothetical protein F5Y11DRAFT_131589 [Daldinia sp. FL1419]